jgi:hypothetical protein
VSLRFGADRGFFIVKIMVTTTGPLTDQPLSPPAPAIRTPATV